MRVLVTRPEADARDTAAVLTARGHIALIDPVLDIRFRPRAELDLPPVTGWLATSRNGVRALQHLDADRSLPLYAVGTSTADLARQVGFATVHDADGDVDALAALVARLVPVGGGPLFHAAGSERAGDLKAALEGAGISVIRQVVYRAEAAEQLRPETVAALQDGTLDAVLFFSPRSAGCFAGLIAASGLVDACRRVTACCISDRAAIVAGDLPFRGIRAAAHPRQGDLLALLDGLE